MRLSKHYVHSIKTVFDNIFQEGNINLFGSRVDDTKKGGDIDWFLEVEDKIRLIEQEARKWSGISICRPNYLQFSKAQDSMGAKLFKAYMLRN